MKDTIIPYSATAQHQNLLEAHATDELYVLQSLAKWIKPRRIKRTITDRPRHMLDYQSNPIWQLKRRGILSGRLLMSGRCCVYDLKKNGNKTEQNAAQRPPTSACASFAEKQQQCLASRQPYIAA